MVLSRLDLILLVIWKVLWLMSGILVLCEGRGLDTGSKQLLSERKQ